MRRRGHVENIVGNQRQHFLQVEGGSQAAANARQHSQFTDARFYVLEQSAVLECDGGLTGQGAEAAYFLFGEMVGA